MKRGAFWLKAVGVAVALAGLAAGAALIAVKIYLPEPKLRAMVLDTAKRQLHRDVRLQSVSVGLWGVSLAGLEISEGPDFSGGKFLSVERFRLRPSWSQLLRKRLVVAAVSADGLSMRVIKDRRGHFNFETLIPPAPASAAKAAPAKSREEPAGFGVRKAHVTNARLEYRDAAAGQAWTASDLDLDLKDFEPSGPFRFKISTRLTGHASGRRVDAIIAASGRADLAQGRPERFFVELKSFSVEQEGLKLSLSGYEKRLDRPKLTLDAVLAASGKTALKFSGEIQLAAANPAADLKAKLKLETPGLNTRLASALFPAARIPALDLPSMKASLEAERHGTLVAIKALNARWKGGKLEASGNIRGLEAAPSVDGEAAFDVDVPEIKPGEYPFLPLPPNVWIPAGHVEGRVGLQGDELRISSFKAHAKAGTVSLSGALARLRSARPNPDLGISLDLDLPAIKASELPVKLSALPPSFMIPALRVSGNLRAKGDDIMLSDLMIRSKAGDVSLTGTIAKALAGTPEPALDVKAKLDLPALTHADLPLPGVPPGFKVPRSRWDADLSYAPRAIRVRNLHLVIGSNELALNGSVLDPAGRCAVDMVVKCKSFSLKELTDLTPDTRDLNLSGTGFFALSVNGTKDKPVFAGKLRFSGISATMDELSLADFSGTLTADPRRVDIPDLHGRVGDGTLRMDLTVKDYARAPDIELEASLDRFDLGRYLAARQKMAKKSAQTPAKSKAAASRSSVALRPLRTKGRLEIGSLTHPNATANNIRASWDISGITPDLRGLNGQARLDVGGGKVHNLGEMSTQSVVVKILVFPLLVVQKIGRLGGIRLFPDFNDITVNAIVGDYLFRDGVMTLRQSEMDSDAARVSARGTIDLPAENLNLVVTAQVANVAPIDVAVTGPASAPKTRVNVAKFLTQPAQQLLKGLFNR